MRPARAGDAVSPIIISANDLAGAWAIGSRGEAMLPVRRLGSPGSARWRFAPA